MEQTLAKTSSVKRSVTIRKDLDRSLWAYPNRSNIINKALELFFAKKAYLEKAEDAFWKEQIVQGLEDIKIGNVFTMNPDGKKMGREAIAKSLGI